MNTTENLLEDVKPITVTQIERVIGFEIADHLDRRYGQQIAVSRDVHVNHVRGIRLNPATRELTVHADWTETINDYRCLNGRPSKYTKTAKGQFRLPTSYFERPVA